MTKVHDLWLIDEADLILALETSPARRLWRPTAREREIGTGRDRVHITASDGGAESRFEFRGPTMTGLGDADLERERERMMRVVDAAHEVVAALDAHLAQRRALTAAGEVLSADTSLVDALERHGGVELRLFLERSRFAEVCWTLRVKDDRTVHAHADRFETPEVGEARPSFPLDLTLDRAEAESHLLGLLEVDVHVRWLDEPTASQTSGAIERSGVLDRCSFRCARSGLVAGSVALRTPRAPGHLHRVELTGFRLTGNAEWSVEHTALSRLRAAMFCRDVRALWSYKSELAPFFCSECGECYEASQWEARHNTVTSVDGICPAGHRRRLCAD